MLILRFFWWAQVYHWTTFYRLNPLQFIFGVVLFPYHLFTRLTYPKEFHAEVVLSGIQVMKAYWEIPGANLPPAFVLRRFQKLELDASK